MFGDLWQHAFNVNVQVLARIRGVVSGNVIRGQLRLHRYSITLKPSMRPFTKQNTFLVPKLSQRITKTNTWYIQTYLNAFLHGDTNYSNEVDIF